MGTPSYGWPAALVLLAGVLVTEMLPVVGGTGADVRFDWAFTYVTLHFVLLPLASGAHVLWNLGALVLHRGRDLRSRLITAGSVIIPLAYLCLLLVRPVFPFMA